MMNLNLNLNKSVKLFLWAWLLPALLWAQSKNQISYGGGIMLGAGYAKVSSDSYSNYADSINSSPVVHLNKGITAWMNYSLDKKTSLQVGLGYLQTGFARKQSGLQFKDPIWPGIGAGFIEDVSQTEKEITYNYRFHYIQVPVLINAYLARSGDFKWIYNFSGGITPQVLVKHNMVANCNTGYSINGEDKFTFDSTGFDARTLSLSVQIGMQIEYKATKEKTWYFQPHMGIYPFSVSSGDNKANPYFFALSVGLLFSGKE